MVALSNFIVAFIFSFIGSIPPGSINLTVIQLGLENRIVAAIRVAVAAALVEYPYAWIAVYFEKAITSSPTITDNLQLLTALVLIVLGIAGIAPKKKLPMETQDVPVSKSGFRRGFILGILNPLAIPYWLGITAYLRSRGWTDLSTSGGLHAYLAGIVCGAMFLLIPLAFLSSLVMRRLIEFPWIRKIPGCVLLILGCYALIDYLLEQTL